MASVRRRRCHLSFVQATCLGQVSKQTNRIQAVSLASRKPWLLPVRLSYRLCLYFARCSSSPPLGLFPGAAAGTHLPPRTNSSACARLLKPLYCAPGTLLNSPNVNLNKPEGMLKNYIQYFFGTVKNFKRFIFETQSGFLEQTKNSLFFNPRRQKN